MENKKSYFAIIPADVRYCENLPANAKLLYGEITALCNERGYCWASNKYFAELYKKSSKTISLWVKALADNGFVEYEVEENNRRKIFMVGVLQKCNGGITKTSRGVLQKRKYNKTVNSKDNNKEIELTNEFNNFWILYDKMVGKKEKIKKKYLSLSLEDRNNIIKYIPRYKQSKPDKQFRKDPATFLNNDGWKDEIISNVQGLNQHNEILNNALKL